MAIEVLPAYAPSGCAFIHESIDKAEIVHVFGEVDIATSPQLESILLTSVRIGKRIIVDLAECSYIDSTVISSLLRAQRALGDHLRIVVAEAGGVARVLSITGVTQVLRLAPSLKHALAS